MSKNSSNGKIDDTEIKESLKEITVVIPTFNCASDLDECLSSLKNQTNKNFKVLIVDGHSKDGTDEIGKKHGAEVIYDEGRSRAHACNTALEHLKKDEKMEFFAFTDADCMPDEHWLEELVKVTDINEKIICSGGPNTAPEADGFIAKCVDNVYGSRIMTGDTRYGKIPDEIVDIYHNPGCNAMYHKEALNTDFDSELPTAEDLAYDHKLLQKGYRIVFNPKAKVWHHRRPTIKGYYKQVWRYGMGRAMANRKYSGLKSTGHILPGIALSVFALLLLSVALFPLVFNVNYFNFSFGGIVESIYSFMEILFFGGIIAFVLLSIYGSAMAYSPYKSPGIILISPLMVFIGYLAWARGYCKGSRMANKEYGQN